MIWNMYNYYWFSFLSCCSNYWYWQYSLPLTLITPKFLHLYLHQDGNHPKAIATTKTTTAITITKTKFVANKIAYVSRNSNLLSCFQSMLIFFCVQVLLYRTIIWTIATVYYVQSSQRWHLWLLWWQWWVGRSVGAIFYENSRYLLSLL